MLLSLRIENFALIDSLSVELGAGLNVLTGETGAGKSIILDAIDAVLGGRVTSRVIRTGCDRALIAAEFALTPDLAAWLAREELTGALGEPAADRLEVSVEISLAAKQDGSPRPNVRSKFRLGEETVVKATVTRLRDRLVELAAQGQTVQLLQPENQRDWLDAFGGAPLLGQRSRVAAAHQRAQQAYQALERRREIEAQRLQQLDLFEFQFQELSVANLSDPQELEKLAEERDRLAHVVELQQQSYQAYQILYAGDGEACADLLAKAEVIFQRMAQFDRQAEPMLEMVTSALTQVVEAGQQVNAYGETLESDPARLAEVEERIGFLKGICRKYGPTLTEAIARFHEVSTALQELGDGSSSIEALEAAYAEAYEALMGECDRLSALRHQAAADLETRLVAELAPLAMERVQFEVRFEQAAPTGSGYDRLVYCFSPNPGEPLQPLGETASGGEMSRFLLALKACFSQVAAVATMVFDEIDVGVSGRVAQAIAQKLHQLSRSHQVLCVTHQPIVAAMADHHYRVDKLVVAAAETRGEKSPKPAKGKRDRRKLAAIPSPHTEATLPPESATAVSVHGEERETTLAMTSNETLEEVSGGEVRTVVRLSLLADADHRCLELAQLASGAEGETSPNTLAAARRFAESLLDRAARLRQAAS